jgi:hypothetical protein
MYDGREQGTYEEKLPCSGRRQSDREAWTIEYYFPGPDRRYNGTFVTVPGWEIDEYIDALLSNWAEYQRLKTTIPKGGAFSREGKLEMTIRVGGFAEGVCLRAYHMPMNSLDRVEHVIGSWRYATHRVKELRPLLFSGVRRRASPPGGTLAPGGRLLVEASGAAPPLLRSFNYRTTPDGILVAWLDLSRIAGRSYAFRDGRLIIEPEPTRAELREDHQRLLSELARAGAPHWIHYARGVVQPEGLMLRPRES